MLSTRTRTTSAGVLAFIALAVALTVSTAGLATARTTSASNSACKKTSGEPVLFSTISNESEPIRQPYYKPSVLAAAQSVNCAGGIHGRPLKVITCDGNIFSNPNNGQNCARDAIAQGVVASAALASPDAAVATAFANAGIPMVGVALNLPGLTSPYSFNPTSGAAGLVAGPAAAMWDKGSHKLRILAFESPLTGAVQGFANTALEPRGGEMLPFVELSADTSADNSALIQATIAGGTDGLILALSAAANIKVIPELRAAGYKGLIATAATLVEPAVVKALGPAESSKLLLSAGYYPESATKQSGIARYNADMAKYAPKVQKVESSISAWSSVIILADALNQAPTVSKEALFAVLNNYELTLDVSPDANFADTGAFGIPRVFTTLTAMQKIKKNGTYYTDVDFFDPLVAPPTKK